jgi:dolichol-phosphate mannosyltransferase/undecaprenyl-phosphate 4-deoxy-4-formamido-L-arabinose transferase
MSVSVILPVYRNARTLPELCERLTKALRPGQFEIILTVDASPDDSAAVARELAARQAEVKVVELARNVGQSRAILAGLCYSHGQVAVVMDADLQDPPEAVPALVQRLNDSPGVDAVFGTRMNRYSNRSRHFTSRLFKFAMWTLSRGKIPPNAGLFLAMRLDLVMRIVMWRNRDVHVLGLVARLTARSAAIAVPRAAFDSGNYTSRMRAAVAWKSVRTLLGLPRSRGITPIDVQRTSNIEASAVSP